MYIEGIKIGDKSYLLSDEDGELTLLKGNGSQEEIEEYIKLENEYEEKMDEKGKLQDDLFELNNKRKESKKANIKIVLSTILIESLFILLGAWTAQIELLLIIPTITIGSGLLGKVLKYGTKKKRTKQKEEINIKLEKVIKEIKEIYRKKQILMKKIEYQYYFWEDEIVPVTTVENKKSNVKMRVLKLKQNGQ